MGKGSKQPTQTYSQVSQSNLPEYARPYFERLMQRSEAESNQPYAMYQGPRIQGFTPDTESAFQGYRNIAAYGNPTVDQAVGLAGTGAGMAASGYAPMMRGVGAVGRGLETAGQGVGALGQGLGTTQMGVGAVGRGLGATGAGLGSVARAMQMAGRGGAPIGEGAEMVRAGAQRAMQAGEYSPLMAGTGEWGQTAANRYMNPYIQSVLDVQRQRAEQRFGEQQGALATAAQRAGAFGGSRQAVQESIARRDLNQQLNEMEAQGLSQAYQGAQQMFTSDQQRALQAALANQGVDLQAAQLGLQGAQAGIGAGQAMGDLGSRYGQLAGTMGQLGGTMGQLGGTMGQLGGQYGQLGGQMGDIGSRYGQLGGTMGQLGGQYGQLGSGMGQLGGTLGQISGTMGQLGGSQQQLYMDRLKALMGVGTAQQELGQRGLDLAEQDFINQRDYERQNIAFQSGILRGIPVSPQSETITRTPGPNPLSQMLGAGIAGSQLANMGRGG